MRTKAGSAVASLQVDVVKHISPEPTGIPSGGDIPSTRNDSQDRETGKVVHATLSHEKDAPHHDLEAGRGFRMISSGGRALDIGSHVERL
jgi:hypothetical protein